MSTTQPVKRFYVHTILQSGVGRKVENPYWVIDRTTNKMVDEFHSKLAAAMAAKYYNEYPGAAEQ